MIAGVSTIRGDADIAPSTVRHLFAQGVDRVYIAAGDDEAWDALHGIPGVHLSDARRDEFHYQQAWVDYLAHTAALVGATWIVPFDADEFWLGENGHSLRDTLESLGPHVGKAYATLWHHQDWDQKVVPAEQLPKVAFRWAPGARIAPGNHNVEIPSMALLDTADVLEIRHLQYRSFEQFREKIEVHNRMLMPEARARGDNAHLRQYDGWDDNALRGAWDRLAGRSTVHDPIPAER